MENEVKALRDEIVGAINGYKAEIDALKANKTASSEELKTLTGALERRIEGLEAQMKRADERTEQKAEKSFVDVLFESDEFKGICNRGYGRVNLDLKGKSLWEYKTLIDTTAVGNSTPGILVPQRVGGIIPVAEQALRVRDVLPKSTTANNAVEFVKENVFTNAASPQVEGSAKAESALTFTIDSEMVRTLAHWIPATRQILADFKGLRSYIDRKLIYGLKLKEDAELLSGSGVGEHLNGLTTQATAYAGTYAVGADTQLDTLRHYIAEVEMSNYQADTVIMNPVDLQKVELLKTAAGGANTGNYLVGNPRLGAFMSPLWGLKVVSSMSMTAGKCLVGAFSMGAEIFDSMGVTIDVSDSHSTFFTENKLAIRCEERLALAVYVPAAFRYGSI